MRVAPELPVDHIERDIDLCTRLIKEVFEYYYIVTTRISALLAFSSRD